MTSNVPELIAALGADDASQRVRAAEALARLGTDARQAAVPLVRACGDSSEEVREWSVAALEEMGPPRSEDLAALAEFLTGVSPDVGYWAATLLGRLEAAAAAAVPDLTVVLSDTSPLAVRQRAAWALGQIGPPAAACLEALRQAATDADPRLARLAQRAVGQIEG